MLPRRSLALLLLVAAGGCSRDAPPPAVDAGAVKPAAPPAPGAGLFEEIRELLREDPDEKSRALGLFPKVKSVCEDAAYRHTFVQEARAAIESETPDSRRLIEDVLEHVATVCWRNDATSGLALVESATEEITGTSRWEILRARLYSAEGRFADAERAAQRAMDLGSIHARALLANIQATRAREEGVGYRAGMFAPALATVATEPDGNWPLIDLTAVLSTRVKLLAERAIWEDEPKRSETLRAAAEVYRRLGDSPFPKQIRGLSLDAMCFDSVAIGETDFAPCARAVASDGNLGAGFLSGKGEDPKVFDLERLEQIRNMRLHLQSLRKKHVVLVVARGDETELAVWARPLAELLETLKAQKSPVVLIDRTASPRAAALLDRAFALAELRPELRLLAPPKEASVLACVSELLADRPAGAHCDLATSERAALAKLGSHGVALLVGRDLDGEIDDLEARDLPRILLSFRLPTTDKPVGVHLKSLSDVWMLSRRAKTVGGSMRARPSKG